MSRTIKLADVIRKAADEHLSPTNLDRYPNDAPHKCVLSCCAVYAAIAISPDAPSEWCDTFDLLTEGAGLTEGMGMFDEFPEGPERQAARFLWLDFLALVAEDEGIEVEVDV